MDHKTEFELILRPSSSVEGTFKPSLIHPSGLGFSVPQSLGPISGKVEICPAVTALQMLVDPKRAEIRRIVSLTKNNMPPVSQFMSTYGIEVLIPEFGDGTRIPQKTFAIIQECSDMIYEAVINKADSKVVFACDSGQSRSIVCAIASIFLAINKLLTEPANQVGLEEWSELSLKQRLISTTLFVNSSRVAGMPSEVVWDSLLDLAKSAVIDQHSDVTSLDDLKLYIGKDGKLINHIFVKSRAEVHHRIAQLEGAGIKAIDVWDKPSREKDIPRYL